MDHHSLPVGPLQNSHFVHLFQKNQAYCLQHNLTMEKVYGGKILPLFYEFFRLPRTIDDVLDSFPSEYPQHIVKHSLNLLFKKGLLIQDISLDRWMHLTLADEALNQKNISLIYLIVSMDCNYRCEYCFIKNNGKPTNNNLMPVSVAQKGVELFAKLAEGLQENIGVTFYGGEPLLNAETVYITMNYIRELEIQEVFTAPVKIAMVTNGSLINETTLEVFAKIKPAVSVSIDGPPQFHDAARKNLAGGGTFERTLSGYRRLQEIGIEPGISCTLSQYNLQNIDDIVEFLEGLKPSGLGFNILLPQVTHESTRDYDYELAAKQVIKAFKVLRNHGVYEDRMMRRVKPYIDKSFHYKDCLGVGGQIVLTPEGRVGFCQAFLGMDSYFPLTLAEMHGKISSLTSEDIYKNPLFDEWRHRFPLNMKECIDCFAIAICGGGCPYAALIDYGSIWEIDRRVCYQAKQMMEWMIWDTYDHLRESNPLGQP